MKQRASVSIEGMSCGHCARAVTEALKRLDSVEVERVEIGSATLRYDPAQVRLDEVATAIEEQGYPVRGLRSQS